MPNKVRTVYSFTQQLNSLDLRKFPTLLGPPASSETLTCPTWALLNMHTEKHFTK